MRIYGPNGTTLGSPASNTRRTSSTGFSLPDTPAAPEETRSSAPPKAAGSIDALLAMQGVEDPTERRKRSVARGRGALDVLDDLKIGLLSGNLDTVHHEPAARCRRQSEVVLRRSRPRRGAVGDRASGRGRTRQGRAVLGSPTLTGGPASVDIPGSAGRRRLDVAPVRPVTTPGGPWYTRPKPEKPSSSRGLRRCTRRRNRPFGPYSRLFYRPRLNGRAALTALQYSLCTASGAAFPRG